MEGKTVVIAGGGPAGAAVAKALADQKSPNTRIYLMEAYAHPLKISKNSPKAYVISVSKRGLDAIKIATGIQNPLMDIPQGVVSSHLCRHPSQKSRARDPPALVIPRKYLASHFLSIAEEAGVIIKYKQRLVDLDLSQKIATFETEDMTTTTLNYDLLVGADGSNSHVRKLLDEKSLTFSVLKEEMDSMEYQVVCIPPPYPFEGIVETATHAWNDKKYNSICLGCPLADKDQCLLLPIVFPMGQFAKFKKQHLQDGKGYDDALNSLFPDLSPGIIESMKEQLVTGEPANGGKCVWCNSFGSPNDGVVLVGDSAHGMWPSLGQGANCALESAAVFAKTVRDLSLSDENNNNGNKDWAQEVVKEFNLRRYNDAIAAVDLTYGGIGKRNSRGRGNSPLLFKLQVVVMMLLNKMSLGIVPKPALFRIMMGESELSYSSAKKWHCYYEKLICVGSVVSIMIAIVIVWSRQT